MSADIVIRIKFATAPILFATLERLFARCPQARDYEMLIHPMTPAEATINLVTVYHAPRLIYLEHARTSGEPDTSAKRIDNRIAFTCPRCGAPSVAERRSTHISRDGRRMQAYHGRCESCQQDIGAITMAGGA